MRTHNLCVCGEIIRLVLQLDTMSHIGPHGFKSLGWLPVSRKIYQIILTHVFKIKSKTLPILPTKHFYSSKFRSLLWNKI